MIVMKFGGSSLEASEAIRRVCGIVKAHQKRQPVIVVSAIGKTTNQLLEMAAKATKGHGYIARRTLGEIYDTHSRIADDLLSGARLKAVDQSLQNAFRELHGIIHDLSEDGGTLTPRLSDYVASFGERLSSELVAAALAGTHVDARDLILTDDRHGSAAPLEWSTYARVRRVIPNLAARGPVVMGGFIGATEAGVTTTLGRGGSDLTATIVGAAICAEEIQIWTDVDGMLTCDPRVLPGGYRVHNISYDEATAMAVSGAKVLHPDTVKPAIRQRIPVVICNSRHPEHAGTRITAEAGACSNPIKTIAVTQQLTILEMTSREIPTGPELLRVLYDFCHRKNIDPAMLCHRDQSVFLALPSEDFPRDLKMELAGCVEVRLRAGVALLSLIGEGAANGAGVGQRALAALRGIDAGLIANDPAALTVSVSVPQQDLQRAVQLLHREFFTTLDATAFSPVPVEPRVKQEMDPMLAFTIRKTALFSSFGRRTYEPGR